MMKSFRKELWFNSPSRREFINITQQVEACLHESGIREGLCLVNPIHRTWHLTWFLSTRRTKSNTSNT